MQHPWDTHERGSGYYQRGRGLWGAKGRDVYQGQGGFTATAGIDCTGSSLEGEKAGGPEVPFGKGAELGCKPHGDLTGSCYRKIRWHEGIVRVGKLRKVPGHIVYFIFVSYVLICLWEGFMQRSEDNPWESVLTSSHVGL